MNLKQIKRQYHKVKSALEELGSSGKFRTSITIQGSSIHIENERPNEELLTRLVVLMRRFLVPNDALYYKKVWRFLKDEYKEFITRETIDKVDQSINDLKKGTIPFKINGSSLTNEDVYRLIANSGYFYDIPNIRERVESSYRNMPIVWDIFWHQFYIYNIEAFNIASILFDVVKEIETNEIFLGIHKEIAHNQCIYCLTEEGKFSTEEHIIPESLGNEEGVLPMGYVCDRCNNGVLSDIDNWFMEFDPIAFLKVLHVPYTKQGKLPSARFQGVSLRKTHPNHLVFQSQSKKPIFKAEEDLGDGLQRWSFNFKGRKKLDPKMVGRFVYKVGIGSFALDFGQNKACTDIPDEIRQFVVKGRDLQNHFLMSTASIRPTHEIRSTYLDQMPATLFSLNVFGIVFIISLKNSTAIHLHPELRDAGFEQYPLFAQS